MIDILARILRPVVIPRGVSEADLLYYLNASANYITAILIAFFLMLVVMVAAVKVKKGWKHFVRWQAVMAFLIVVTVSVNAVCYGPLYNNVSGYLNASKVELAEDTVSQSLATIEKIGEEGFVLVKNEDMLPLPSGTTKINVFGWASTVPILGGTGSSASSAAAATDILQSLEEAGYETNSTLTDMYRNYRGERPVIDMNGQDLTLPEPTVDYYTEELMEEAKAFSDTAMIVIGRIGGEDYDLPVDMHAVIEGSYNIAQNVSVSPANYTYFNAVYENNGDYDDFDEGESYLELSNTEEAMIEKVCSNFNHVIVVVNANNAMELGWVDEYEQIGAVILTPAPGVSGFRALGKIINGTVNPSGKTSDTYVRDLLDTPTIHNIGNKSFTNVDAQKMQIAEKDSTYEGSASFLNYVEGIYVGYKFYETAAEEGLFDYEDKVQYPFGYGLSYTTFEKTIENFRDRTDEITFDVRVANTGETAGRDVVEVYYTPPYSNGGIEKASVNLIDFEKTGLLNPGETETVSFSIAKEDMASYDSGGIKVDGGGYILEAGEYRISVRSDSHHVVAEESFHVRNDIDYSIDGRASDRTAATNQLEGHSRGDFEQLSRADGFANYGSTCGRVLTEEDFLATEEEISAILENTVAGYDGSRYDNKEDEMPDFEADNGLTLADLSGADYEDERWELLLDQMSYDDMLNLVNAGGWQTVAVKSIGKVATSDCDGPAGLNNFITGAYGTTFPAEVLMGQTWSKEMALEIGSSMGSEFAAAENFGWYGPAMNIHRSVFGGRNFEYYSEDGVLSGIMAGREIQGAAQFGVYPYLKHFALNDQETNRCGVLLTYASEQAIREIYLKPFEIAVKNFQGKSMAVMSSFNWIGTIPACADGNLLHNVLREEWGFRGMVESDYDGSYGYMISDNCIRNGNDLMLGFGGYETNKLDKRNASVVAAMRQASKNILYTIANSGYYADGTPIESADNMGRLFTILNVSVAAAVCLVECLLILRIVWKKRKEKRKIVIVEEGETGKDDLSK